MILDLDRVEEIKTQYSIRRKNVLKSINKLYELYAFEDTEVLTEIVHVFKLFDELIKQSYSLVQADNIRDETLDLSAEAMVINTYKADSIFNADKASKWLINALILVVIRGYSFDGVFFSNGEKKILKNKILKHDNRSKSR